MDVFIKNLTLKKTVYIISLTLYPLTVNLYLLKKPTKFKNKDSFVKYRHGSTFTRDLVDPCQTFGDRMS